MTVTTLVPAVDAYSSGSVGLGGSVALRSVATSHNIYLRKYTRARPTE